MNASINRVAASATLHCLTGCAIGEVLGMVIGNALNWDVIPTVALAVGLAFIFGYSLSLIPVLRHGIQLRKALKLVLAADTLSILVMEIADNGFILLVPGAIHAGLNAPLFWISLILSLAVAFVAAFPVNRFLIQRGKGHALIQDTHHHSH
jgi:hypothetical protein